jgi:hypothetical protein
MTGVVVVPADMGGRENLLDSAGNSTATAHRHGTGRINVNYYLPLVSHRISDRSRALRG